MSALEPVACPGCVVRLEESPGALTCPQCLSVYKLQPGGFYDLRPDQTEYADWMSSSPEAMADYLRLYAPSERAGAQHMMRIICQVCWHRSIYLRAGRSFR